MVGTENRPLRVAVIGSGPSGFYAVDALFRQGIAVKVDMFEKLPSPFGLVRYGVAPDHPKIKSVIRVYEKIAENKNFSFFGNVKVGDAIKIDELKEHYDGIIFTCGAETDKKLGIPGEDLKNSYTATEFVAWYNGHPEYQDRVFDLSNNSAMIIGQGNVAMDVSRILCKSVDELKNTDITGKALECLAESKIKEIHLVGRRGPAQTACTAPELKEFSELEECEPVASHKEDFILNPESIKELEIPEFALKKKNYNILREYSERTPSGKPRKFVIHFFRSPKELKGEERVEKVVIEKNKLVGEAGAQKARGTGEMYELDCELFFRSVGYRGVPIDGVPFRDDWGIFPNEKGRITENGTSVPGLYTAGWIKRGPSGVVGTNKPDSVETVNSLIEDLKVLKPCATPDSNSVKKLLEDKGIKVVNYENWKKIDAAEIERGRAKGKPREKFLTVREMLAVIF